MTFRWLVALAAWLDRRFPPKVVVTEANYAEMQEKLHRHNRELARLAGENLAERGRIDSLEKSLAALKEGIVKGVVPVAPADKVRLREEFIKGEGEAWGRPQSSSAKPVVEAAS